MSELILSKNPIDVYAREATAARRIGANKKCACGESRPRALVPKSNPTICFRCLRIKKGYSVMDNHHVAGESNDPTTIPVDVDDHNACLNVKQYCWPKQTLENPCGSPLLRASGSVRGVVDTIVYLLKKFLLWIPEFLESLDTFLRQKLGQKWWIGTEFEQFAPKN